VSDTLFSKKYTVHHVLKSNQYMNIFVGETKQQNPQKVLLNEWTDKTLIQMWLAVLLDMKQKNNSDMIDCFSENGNVYTVFCYQEGKNLLQYVQSEKLALHYRIVLLKNILEAYLKYQHYNDMIQFCMLQYQNIMIQNYTILFNYQLLVFPEQYECNCFGALEQTMKVLFTNEEYKSIPKLLIVVQKCQKRIYQSLGEMIKDLQDVLGAEQKQKSMEQYVVEKRKYNRKKWLIVLILIAFILLIAMIYRKYQNIDDTFLYTHLEQIGNVEIITEQKNHIQQINEDIHVTQKQQVPQQIEFQQTEQYEDVQQEPLQKAEESKTYTVKAGDNLIMICFQYYGDGGYAQSLADYNNIKNVNIIYTKQILTLPPKSELQKIPLKQTVSKQSKPTSEPEPTTQQEIQIPQQYEQNAEQDMSEYILLLEEEDYS